jgi:hypothetical protein
MHRDNIYFLKRGSHDMKRKRNEYKSMNYSPKIATPNFLALALTQSLFASPLIKARRIVGGADLLRKILTLHSFQIVQLTNMVREVIVEEIISNHHVLELMSVVHSFVLINGSPS